MGLRFDVWGQLSLRVESSHSLAGCFATPPPQYFASRSRRRLTGITQAANSGYLPTQDQQGATRHSDSCSGSSRRDFSVLHEERASGGGGPRG